MLSDNKTTKSLSKVLKQSEQVKDAVKECADDLSVVNVILKQELAIENPLPSVKNAIQKNETVEDKVQEAVEQLSLVNQALKLEIKEREILEEQLVLVQAQEEAFSHAALHDDLTGLPSRALFNDRLEHGLDQAKRHGWMLAIMFLDLDGFKSINDSYGHDVGDIVLQTTAQRLINNMRADDTVSRHGGDEFLYLLMEVQNKNDIVTIAKKIISAIKVPCKIGDLNLIVQSSIGISVFPNNGNTAEVLIKSADKAMYEAKLNKLGYSFAP